MADQIREEAGQTRFGGNQVLRSNAWFNPSGRLGRWYSRFFATKSLPYVAKQGDFGPTPMHPLAGDTWIKQDVITGDSVSPSKMRYPKVPEQELNRRKRYNGYESMDEYPEISTAFDIYADDSTQKDLNNKAWVIDSDSKLVIDEADRLFKTIRLDRYYWDIIRNVVKYGDCFVEMVIDVDNPKLGIQRIKILNPFYILRVENEYGYLTDFLQEIPDKNDWTAFGWQSESMRQSKFVALDKNQIVHFRLFSSDPLFYPYGRSIAALCIRIFRSLRLMEDAMLIYRLSRAPERRVFYIDVGALPTNKAEMFIERIKQKFKKEKFFNPVTNDVDERYNPLCFTGDTKIPLLDGRNVSLEDLAKEDNEFIEVWASDGEKLVPAKATKPFISGYNAHVLKLTLDNGEEIKCTPNHKFLLRDGLYKEAQHLTLEDSIFPFYSRIRNNYLQIQETPGKGWRNAHRVIGENIFGVEECKGNHIYHLNKEKLDNSLSNLQLLSPGDHVKEHFGDNWHSIISKYKSKKTRSKNEFRKLKSKQMKEYWKNNSATELQIESARIVQEEYLSTPANLERASLHMKKLNSEKVRDGRNNPNWRGGKVSKECEYCSNLIFYYLSQNRKFCSRECQSNAKVKFGKYSTKYFNHKVVKIEDLGIVDKVYDLTVDKYHNFALTAGVVVHNSMDEDFFVPFRGQKRTDIQTLPGAENLGEIDDVKYFLDKILAALKIPKDYIVEKDKSPERKANLSQLDVKFARTITRVQREVEEGFTAILRRHLRIKGFPTSLINDVRFRLADPSDMFTKRKLDVDEQKTRVVQSVLGLGLFDKEHIYKEYYHMSDLEIKEMIRKVDKEMEKEAEKAAQGLMPGAGPGGMPPPGGGMENMMRPEEAGPGEAGDQEPEENAPPTQNPQEQFTLNSSDLLLECGDDPYKVKIMNRLLTRYMNKLEKTVSN